MGLSGHSSDECSVVVQTVGRRVEFGPVGPPLCAFSLTTTTQMDRPFDRKSKKSLKPSQRHVSLGIPTNIAIGPLGFRAELNIDPECEQRCSPHDLGADQTGSTAVLDENSTGAARIVFQDKNSEDQKLPAQKALNHGVVIGGDGRRGCPISKCA